MPGTSGGTGLPLFLRCAKCKKYSDWRSHRPIHLEATGKTKPCKKWSAGGIRQARQYIEYRCLDCGHVGWSKHADAQRLLDKKLAAKTEEKV